MAERTVSLLDTDTSRSRKRPRGSGSSSGSSTGRRNNVVEDQNGGNNSSFAQFSSTSSITRPSSADCNLGVTPAVRRQEKESAGPGTIGSKARTNSSLSGTKGNDDQNDDPYGDDDFDLDGAADDVPNDTLVAILSLQQQFYGGTSGGAAAAAAAGRRGNGTPKPRTGLVLQHQIYTVLQNRTAVDLELTAMRKNNTLRTFRLSTGREDWGVMSTDHYLKVISTVLGDTTQGEDGDALTESGTSSSSYSTGKQTARGDRVPSTVGSNTSTSRAGLKQSRVDATSARVSANEAQLGARDVLERILQTNRRAYASRKEVAVAMREVLLSRKRQSQGDDGGGVSVSAAAAAIGGRRSGKDVGKPIEGEGEEVEEEERDLITIKRKEAKVVALVGELIRAGFLLPRRDVGREEAYWFSVPQLGKIIASVSRGRKDIVNMLKRTRYKEIRRSVLESKNPAKTGLPLIFHIRDLVGLGLVREFDTPSGAFIRLAPDT